MSTKTLIWSTQNARNQRSRLKSRKVEIKAEFKNAGIDGDVFESLLNSEIEKKELLKLIRRLATYKNSIRKAIDRGHIIPPVQT